MSESRLTLVKRSPTHSDPRFRRKRRITRVSTSPAALPQHYSPQPTTTKHVSSGAGCTSFPFSNSRRRSPSSWHGDGAGKPSSFREREQNLPFADTSHKASSADFRRRRKMAISGPTGTGDDHDAGNSSDDAEARRINDLRVRRLEMMQSMAQKPRWNRGVTRSTDTPTEPHSSNADSKSSQVPADAYHSQPSQQSTDTRESSRTRNPGGSGRGGVGSGGGAGGGCGGRGLTSLSSLVTDHLHGSGKKGGLTPRTRNKFADVLTGIVDRGREKSDDNSPAGNTGGQNHTSASQNSGGGGLTANVSPTISPGGITSPIIRASGPSRTASFRTLASALAPIAADHHKSDKNDKHDREPKKKKRIIHRRQRSSGDGTTRPTHSLLATLGALHPSHTSSSPIPYDGLETTIPTASPRTRRSNSMDMATMSSSLKTDSREDKSRKALIKLFDSGVEKVKKRLRIKSRGADGQVEEYELDDDSPHRDKESSIAHLKKMLRPRTLRSGDKSANSSTNKGGSGSGAAKIITFPRSPKRSPYRPSTLPPPPPAHQLQQAAAPPPPLQRQDLPFYRPTTSASTWNVSAQSNSRLSDPGARGHKRADSAGALSRTPPAHDDDDEDGFRHPRGLRQPRHSASSPRPANADARGDGSAGGGSGRYRHRSPRHRSAEPQHRSAHDGSSSYIGDKGASLSRPARRGHHRPSLSFDDTILATSPRHSSNSGSGTKTSQKSQNFPSALHRDDERNRGGGDASGSVTQQRKDHYPPHPQDDEHSSPSRQPRGVRFLRMEENGTLSSERPPRSSRYDDHYDGRHHQQQPPPRRRYSDEYNGDEQRRHYRKVPVPPRASLAQQSPALPGNYLGYQSASAHQSPQKHSRSYLDDDISLHSEPVAGAGNSSHYDSHRHPTSAALADKRWIRYTPSTLPSHVSTPPPPPPARASSSGDERMRPRSADPKGDSRYSRPPLAPRNQFFPRLRADSDPESVPNRDRDTSMPVLARADTEQISTTRPTHSQKPPLPRSQSSTSAPSRSNTPVSRTGGSRSAQVSPMARVRRGDRSTSKGGDPSAASRGEGDPRFDEKSLAAARAAGERSAQRYLQPNGERPPPTRTDSHFAASSSRHSGDDDDHYSSLSPKETAVSGGCDELAAKRGRSKQDGRRGEEDGDDYDRTRDDDRQSDGSHRSRGGGARGGPRDHRSDRRGNDDRRGDDDRRSDRDHLSGGTRRLDRALSTDMGFHASRMHRNHDDERPYHDKRDEPWRPMRFDTPGDAGALELDNRPSGSRGHDHHSSSASRSHIDVHDSRDRARHMHGDDDDVTRIRRTSVHGGGGSSHRDGDVPSYSELEDILREQRGLAVKEHNDSVALIETLQTKVHDLENDVQRLSGMVETTAAVAAATSDSGANVMRVVEVLLTWFIFGLNTLAAPLQWMYARFLVYREQQRRGGTGKSMYKEELISFSPRSLLRNSPRKPASSGGGGSAGQDGSGSRQGHGRATVSHSREDGTNLSDDKSQPSSERGAASGPLADVDSKSPSTAENSTPPHVSYELAQQSSPHNISNPEANVTRRPSNSSYAHSSISPYTATRSSTPAYSRHTRMPSPLHSMRPPVTTSTHYIFEDPSPSARGSDAAHISRMRGRDSRMSNHTNSPRMEISVSEHQHRDEPVESRERDRGGFDSHLRPSYTSSGGDGMRQRFSARDRVRNSDDPLERFYVSRSGRHDRGGASRQLDHRDLRRSLGTLTEHFRDDERDRRFSSASGGDERPPSAHDFGSPSRAAQRR